MPEKAKRLTPTGDVLRELFLKSGNLCAFPGCVSLMMNAAGVFVGQVCHIEAAEVGGERFNIMMTNEERRHVSNLMLMCYAHHKETNDVVKFPADRLRHFKADHEQRFARPDRAMLENLQDWTKADEPSMPRSLIRLNTVLGWERPPEDLQECLGELHEYIERLRRTPIELRRFLGAVVQRIHTMRETRVVRETLGAFGVKILVSDLKGAFKLSERAICDRANQLEGYGLGVIDEMDTELGPKAAVFIGDLRSGWKLWFDLIEFCEKAPESMNVFIDDLDFARLDS